MIYGSMLSGVTSDESDVENEDTDIALGLDLGASNKEDNENEKYTPKKTSGTKTPRGTAKGAKGAYNYNLLP